MSDPGWPAASVVAAALTSAQRLPGGPAGGADDTHAAAPPMPSLSLCSLERCAPAARLFVVYSIARETSWCAVSVRTPRLSINVVLGVCFNDQKAIPSMREQVGGNHGVLCPSSVHPRAPRRRAPWEGLPISRIPIHPPRGHLLSVHMRHTRVLGYAGG
ncbi:hypothetical protein GQ53DRAFT_97653 [Thozetella sp. PMI_491]|nr:hypothetical protein GQ53DRAFT_97653 [Thozetella sp. PMI_491]